MAGARGGAAGGVVVVAEVLAAEALAAAAVAVGEDVSALEVLGFGLGLSGLWSIMVGGPPVLRKVRIDKELSPDFGFGLAADVVAGGHRKSRSISYELRVMSCELKRE